MNFFTDKIDNIRNTITNLDSTASSTSASFIAPKEKLQCFTTIGQDELNKLITASKPKLDPCELANYRPISNLPFMSNILEKVDCSIVLLLAKKIISMKYFSQVLGSDIAQKLHLLKLQIYRLATCVRPRLHLIASFT